MSKAKVMMKMKTRFRSSDLIRVLKKSEKDVSVLGPLVCCVEKEVSILGPLGYELNMAPQRL